MVNKNPLSASELGTLWFTYQEKTLILRFLEYFQAKSNDQEAQNILGQLMAGVGFLRHSPNYLKGFTPFGDKRALNTIELGSLHHAIETNNIGMQLITGFAQCAKTKEVKQFFVKGMELAKKQIQTFEEILLEGNVHSSATFGSTVTTSTVAPFSEKLMMNCIFLLNGFGLVGASFATIFSLRNDIAMKTILLAKDVFSFTHEGVKIMMKHGWLEEPPQMEDRPHIINNG